MPVTMARSFLGNIMAPKPDQLSYLKAVEKPKWKGTWIGERLANIHDEKELNQRINDADIIIFYAHGKKDLLQNKCNIFICIIL